jgi:hypothetical protein
MSPGPNDRSGRKFGQIETEALLDISPVRPPANLDEIDVVCCICEEPIPYSQVDAHSRQCEF